MLLQLQYQGRTRRGTPGPVPTWNLLNQLILRRCMNKNILIKQVLKFNSVNCSFGILVFVRGIMPIEKMQSPDCITYAHEIHHGR